jgi:hypothetical protein
MMARLVHPEIRKTHKYVGTSQHMDDWESVPGRFKALRGRGYPPDDDTDYSDGGKFAFTVVAPREHDPKKVMQALRDSFTSQGCAHQYDCCGCESRRASVKRIRKSREYRVVQSISYNY